MRRTEINGIPLYWDDVPGQFAVHLVFGTGIVDEPLPRLGITELAGQLALAAVADAARACDEIACAAEDRFTRFSASGEPERVAEFVNLLCRALAEPPVDGLAVAVRRVQARRLREECWDRFQERELGFRYGLRGPGRVAWAAPAVAHIGAADVRAWAAERFTRDGAVLVLSGRPPTALDPRLPQPPHGPRAGRPVVEPLPDVAGCWIEGPDGYGEQVTVSFEGPATPAGHLAADIARGRALSDERVTVNLTGSLEVAFSYVGGGRMLFWLVAETDELGVQGVAEGLDATLRELVERGPAEGEVRRAERAWSERLDGDDQRHGHLVTAALDHLAGLEVFDVAGVRARLASLGPADVRTALAAYDSTAVLTLPEHCAPGPDSPFAAEPDRSGGAFHEAYEYRPKFFGPAGRADRMYLSDEGLAHWTTNCHHAVRWHQVAGLGVFPEGRRVLYGECGTVIDIQADWYKSGGDLIAAVDARVPASLRFPMGEAEPI
ncbi:hypothetical protein ACFUJR_28835 [Streptomyces sp. NPDC057271]|uniref:hypothetical protein n=1 Tax=unclassified Streptomyces TaxID=2593676 RepID=UPI003631B86F